MAQQTLQTVIALSGRVDNSFGRIGEALTNIGMNIDAISQKVIRFGTDSVNSFASYDDIMREVQALGEYDSKTMQKLDAYNKSIAQTSRYTMEQAAQAEVMMAQLGLNMNQTQTLMPTVMNLATAANIDLADSLDYLYYTLSALGMPMEYANTLSDQMSKTAAISAADIDTLGQSMQRLGSGVQFFAGGSSEILAILGGISQFGSDMQGSNAGTQLRNFMLTLLAPTQSKDTMLKSLWVTEEEWAEFETYMEDAGIDVNNTAEAMSELGLSVYDSATGELKPAIQIIGELSAALSTLSTGEKNEMLGNLFGKRTTTTALNLMETLGTIIEYQKEIEEGSDGYTVSMAETMEGGIGGTLREFTAALDAFNTTIGESAAPMVESAAGFMTEIVNGLSNMDKDALDAIVSASTVVAAAGPALLLASGAFRMIGFATTPIGAAAVGLTALAAAAGAIYQLAEADFADNFGDMELDSSALLSYVNGLSEAFNAAYADVNAYNTAVQTAVENYTSASSTLSSDLLTNMITGSTLTTEQMESISALGETMGDELLAGINASFDKSASYLTMLFGGLDSAYQDDDYSGAILLAQTMRDSLIGQAEQLGKEFGETLGSAMDDGIITGEEYSVIMEKMQAYNDAMAVFTRADQAANLAQKLHKAQSVSWDSAEAFLAEQAEIMNANLSEAEMTHIGERAKWEVYFDEAINNGWINPDTGEAYSDLDKIAFLANLDAQYASKVQGYRDDNAAVTQAVFDTLMSQSEYGNAWGFLSMLYGSGNLKRDAQGNIDWGAVDWDAILPGGIPDAESIGQYALFNDLEKLYRAEVGFLGTGNKLTGILEPYMGSEAIAIYREMIESANTVASEIYSASLNNQAYGDMQQEAGEAAAQSLMDGYGEPELSATIDAEAMTEDATLAGSSAADALYNAWGSPVLKATVRYSSSYYAGTTSAFSRNKFLRYEEGGRATQASIFGEAGPEWAIPEEHSDRVANLLNMAREASGFTWPELISRTGGLNAGGRIPTQLIYSPTIVAADAAGVEQKLIEDKARLDRWWAEKQMHDEIEVFDRWSS